MRFVETELEGAYVIEPERLADERGFFARTWCRDAFAAHGLNATLWQCNVSHNCRKGTVRGLHFQTVPYEEAKLVRCTRGAIHDVVIDLRKDSSTFADSMAIELSEENCLMLYIPEGCAHGFQTLEDSTQLFYQMSGRFHAEAACGIRWNDPRFNIAWPLPITAISKKDLQYPDFR